MAKRELSFVLKRLKRFMPRLEEHPRKGAGSHFVVLDPDTGRFHTLPAYGDKKHMIASGIQKDLVTKFDLPDDAFDPNQHKK